jgi:lipopolysaccharide export system permease protein
VNVLTRYIVGLYLRTFAVSLFGALGLVLVVEFFQRIGDFAAYDSDASMIAAYFLMKIPKMLADIYPAAALLAALLGVGALVRTNEVLALHSCGVSVLRLARPLLATSIALSTLVLVWNESVVPPTAARARAIKDIGIKGLGERGMLDATSLWMQVPEGFLNIDYFDANRQTLAGVTLHGIDEGFHLARVIEIEKAAWNGTRWVMEGGTVRTFSPEGGFEYAPLGLEAIDLGGTPTEFRRKAPRADEFNMRQLAQRIRTLKAKGLDPAAFEVDLQFKVALPLSGLITVLIGLPLALRGSRRSGTAQHLGTGMGICFAYWLTQALTVSAGHAGTLPPVVAPGGGHRLPPRPTARRSRSSAGTCRSTSR